MLASVEDGTGDDAAAYPPTQAKGTASGVPPLLCRTGLRVRDNPLPEAHGESVKLDSVPTALPTGR